MKKLKRIELWVDSDAGDDRNLGINMDYPLRTIGEALKRLVPGGRIFLAQGTYAWPGDSGVDANVTVGP